MAIVRYHQYIGELWEDLNLEDLVGELSDFLLQSGFGEDGEEWDEDSLQALHDAILEALMRRGLLSDEDLQKLMNDADALEQFLQKTVERLVREGYLKTSESQPFHDPTEGRGGWGKPGPPVRFELTEKGVDFLGYKSLRNLLGTLGKSSLGHHDTRDLATGVEASGPSKPYEFGDTLNLDISGTLLSAVAREGLKVPLDVDYKDLLVHQAEYQSSCATVVMLDCSHSMILYGEDRFTPAKKVALALSHLIRTQYPGDSLKVVLFHDDAEELPLARLATTQVGPYHTNTAEGLKLARRLLQAQRKEMKQIVMVTDGKPTACFLDAESALPGGRRLPFGEITGGRRLYKNSMGGDPVVMDATFREVQACRKAGIQVNTFMLASDSYLVEFVKQMTAMTSGKAYFATPGNLTQFVLIDFLRRKKSRVK